VEIACTSLSPIPTTPWAVLTSIQPTEKKESDTDQSPQSSTAGFWKKD
jgi:hypothetical protein